VEQNNDTFLDINYFVFTGLKTKHSGFACFTHPPVFQNKRPSVLL